MTRNQRLKSIFIVDNMIRGLVTWLRFLGIPSRAAVTVSEAKKIQSSHPEAIFITSSKRHLRESEIDKTYLVRSNQIADQLHELNRMFDIFDKIELLSLCSICNIPIEFIAKEQIRDRVPEKVWNSFDQFWICPGCKRIYWKGGHVKRLTDKMKRMGLPVPNDPPDANPRQGGN